MNRPRMILAPAAALLVLLAGSPAYAASWMHDDARRDVIVATCTDVEADECTEEVDPSVTIPDITRVSVAHTSTRVVVRIRQVHLGYAQNRVHMLRIATNEGITRDVNVMALAGDRRPMMTELSRPSGRTLACKGLTAEYDYALDRTTISVPRTCLSGPRWVKVGAGAVTFDDEFTTFHGDDAQRDGAFLEAPAMSPRIARG